MDSGIGEPPAMRLQAEIASSVPPSTTMSMLGSRGQPVGGTVEPTGPLLPPRNSWVQA